MGYYRLDETVPVCTFVPKLNPLGCGATVTFVVDTTKVPVMDLSTDNLGAFFFLHFCLFYFLDGFIYFLK